MEQLCSASSASSSCSSSSSHLPHHCPQCLFLRLAHAVSVTLSVSLCACNPLCNSVAATLSLTLCHTINPRSLLIFASLSMALASSQQLDQVTVVHRSSASASCLLSSSLLSDPPWLPPAEPCCPNRVHSGCALPKPASTMSGQLHG